MKLVFTKRAKKNYDSIKDYLEEEWGDLIAKAFEAKIKHFFDLLEKFSELGELEVPEKGIRGFQLTKHTRVFYRIKTEQIIILSVFDVRQNPKKRPGK